MRIITSLKENLVYALLFGVGIFFLPPLIQRINTPLAFEIWYKTIFDKPFNSFLYIVFSLLFGIFISLYIYTKNKCFDCDKRDFKLGFGGTTLGFIIGICPACFSLIAALIPLSGIIFLTNYSHVFTALSIIIILFSIYKIGGFK